MLSVFSTPYHAKEVGRRGLLICLIHSAGGSVDSRCVKQSRLSRVLKCDDKQTRKFEVMERALGLVNDTCSCRLVPIEIAEEMPHSDTPLPVQRTSETNTPKPSPD